MYEIIRITLKGIFRDRVFQGIMVLALLFLLIPSAATFSMRQVTELALTLCLSLISFILLLLTVFLGATSIWRDIERRYTYSVLSLPLQRSDYLLGRFLGIALFLCLTILFLGLIAAGAIAYTSSVFPQNRPMVWGYVLVALGFDLLRYILLAAIALLLSTLSTSFFLPIFGTISIYWVGSFSQDVYDFLQTPSGTALSPLVRQCAKCLYYILPNLSAFDYKVNAIYALAPDAGGMLMTLGYFGVYVSFLLCVAAIILGRKELR